MLYDAIKDIDTVKRHTQTGKFNREIDHMMLRDAIKDMFMPGGHYAFTETPRKT
jgi:hypothetical protein